MITTLTNIVCNNPQSPIWIAGDFNLPIINWSDGSISGNNYPHTFAELLLDFSNTDGFTQMVVAPTRKHNILDLFLTNRPSLFKSCKVIPGFSDHEIVHIPPYVSAPCKLNSRKVFLWHKANFDLIKEVILNFNNSFLNDYTLDTPINTLWNKFKCLCESCLAPVPQKQTSNQVSNSMDNCSNQRLSRQKQRSTTLLAHPTLQKTGKAIII